MRTDWPTDLARKRLTHTPKVSEHAEGRILSVVGALGEIIDRRRAARKALMP